MIIILIISYFFGADKVSPQVVGLVVATLGLFWLWRRQQKAKKLNGLKELPGPRGLPVLGNLLQLGTQPNKQFCKWTEKYGDMYQVKVGVLRTLIVSDAKLCKEIFSNDNLTGRIQSSEFQMYKETGLGMFSSEGERWEVHRRHLLRQLRDLGFGKSSMETLIMDEVNEILSSFRKKAGQPITEIRETLRLAVVNSLWTIMSSQRYEHNDPELLKLSNNTTKAVNEVFAKGGLLIFLPWTKHFLPDRLTGYRAIRDVLDEHRSFFEQTIQEHKKNFKEGEIKDFIDAFLWEMKKAENDPTSMFYGETAERQLTVTLFDLFFAGSDTTSTTIQWSVLYLCKFPEVQRKLQAEISEITGGSRSVSVNDRSNMPYTQAMIDEILRFSSLTPDGVQHRAMADTNLNGYFIPKDMLVQPNSYYIHHNPKIWGDPENFRPERFLTDGGTKFVRSENVQAFQVGKRQCVGESLARDSIFLYVTNLFQQFDVSFKPDEPEPGVESEIGFLRAPFPFSVIMKERIVK